MALDLDDVRRVSQLARLRLDDAQTHALLDDLNAIFGMIAEMEAVDTADVVPMSHPRDVSQRLRPDVATEPDRREVLLKLAPATAGGLYLVPRVVE
jgi:aspartyl-tRNA(Asn)/glutamyl-tRNA(Gln) amidotransferase subunit C